MVKTLAFDETESLSDILDTYRSACDQCSIGELEKMSGEEFIRSFHADIVASAGLGNQARVERIIGTGRHALRIVFLARCRRRGLRRFLASLFGGS